MEAEKSVKKNNTPLLIMLAAVLLIVAGVVLIVTGNNKSFMEKKETKEPNKEEQKPTDEDNEDEIPDKGLTPTVVTEDEIINLLVQTKEKDFPGETWRVEGVVLLGHDEENEKILISYNEVQEDSTIVTKQTIVSILNGEKSVELPGWVEGERDLTVYNFISYDSKTETNEGKSAIPEGSSAEEDTVPNIKGEPGLFDESSEAPFGLEE